MRETNYVHRSTIFSIEKNNVSRMIRRNNNFVRFNLLEQHLQKTFVWSIADRTHSWLQTFQKSTKSFHLLSWKFYTLVSNTQLSAQYEKPTD